jgi:hypothetical protein
VGISNFWGGTIQFCMPTDLQRKKNFYKYQFLRNQKYENCRRLLVKIHILFWGDNSWTAAIRQTKFHTVKDHGHTYKFHLKHYFLWQSFWKWRWYEILRLCCCKRWSALYVEFCNFAQFVTFVKYLSCYY